MTSKLFTKFICICLPIFIQMGSFAQFPAGSVSGNFQNETQFYNPDSTIGAPVVPEKILTNGFANINYTHQNFSAGLRYESYLNVLQGFDPRYVGNGILYRYANYKADLLDVTVGSFYEQFGNGLILRSYEERGLGIDNSMDGIRLKYDPVRGIYLKGFVARQRSFFTYGPGIVRGFDGETLLNELIPKMSASKTTVIVGGGIVSRYQKDQNPIYILPENVGAYAGRINLIRGKINLMAEYAEKINDPSAVNELIYKNGQALFISAAYSRKNFGLSLGAKRLDNMDYKSDRNALGNNLSLNYLPNLTKQHTYSLSALYPYATQPLGEMGFQADMNYRIKPGSKLGGKYGTTLALNYSTAHSIDTINLGDERGYSSDFFKIGKNLYFQDINIEIGRKINTRTKIAISNVYLIYDKGVIQKPGEPVVYANISIVEINHKLSAQHNLRAEVQHLLAGQDKGDWGMALLEYSVAPKWFISVFDEYNYGNDDKKKQIHYFTGGIAYVKEANRISMNYGRQREGIFCVGGVCRNVPASNGISLSITSSF